MKKVNRQICLDQDLDIQMRLHREVNWSNLFEETAKAYLNINSTQDREEEEIIDKLEYWGKKEDEARKEKINTRLQLIHLREKKDREMKQKNKDDEEKMDKGRLAIATLKGVLE